MVRQRAARPAYGPQWSAYEILLGQTHVSTRARLREMGTACPAGRLTVTHKRQAIAIEFLVTNVLSFSVAALRRRLRLSLEARRLGRVGQRSQFSKIAARIKSHVADLFNRQPSLTRSTASVAPIDIATHESVRRHAHGTSILKNEVRSLHDSVRLTGFMTARNQSVPYITAACMAMASLLHSGRYWFGAIRSRNTGETDATPYR